MGLIKKAVLFIVVIAIIGAISSNGNSNSAVSGNAVANNEAQQCTPSWSCTDWSQCSASGRQTRTCTDTNNCGSLSSKPIEYQSCTPPRQYASVDWDTLESYFWLDSLYTNLQKDNLVDQNKGKWINGTGIINSVGEDILGDYYINLLDPTNQFNVFFITLYFDESEKNELLTLSENEDVTFTCKIKDSSSITGLYLEKCELV